MSQDAFRTLSKEFVDESLKLDPVMATMVGVHEYDAELGDPSTGAMRREIDWLRQQARLLDEEVVESELGPYERTDFLYLRSRIRSSLLVLDGQRERERNPILYPDSCMYGIFLLFTRDFAPLSERLDPLLKRLERSSVYLGKARETVLGCPRIFAEVAAEVAQSAEVFLQEIRSTLLREAPEAKEAIERAIEIAQRGFKEYAEWVERDLLPHSSDTFAIGRELFDARLREEHLLPHDTVSLEKLGWELLRATQAEMTRVADSIESGKSWQDVVAAAKAEHPSAGDLLDAYRREVDRARSFIVDRRLVAMPPDEELEIIETPVFERSRVPYAAYLMPGAFDRVQKGSFYVTTVSATESREEREATLQGHNTHSIPLVALHEAYPGHHLQLCWANRSRSALRKLADSSVLAEGWALYCEEMMFEEGFFEHPLVRLFQLKDLCWRAARVVLDCRLHTGASTVEEAVDFLVKEAQLERPNAEVEVKRYTATPTQPMSYAVGKQALLDLRDEVRGKLGAGFELHDFHTAVLQAGTLPVGLVRDEALQILELGVS